MKKWRVPGEVFRGETLGAQFDGPAITERDKTRRVADAQVSQVELSGQASEESGRPEGCRWSWEWEAPPVGGC